MPPDTLRLPSRDDPVVAGASTLVGGTPGEHTRPGSRTSLFWTPLRLLLLLTLFTCSVGYAQKSTCRDTRNWAHEYQYTRMCYSDVVALYSQEGLAAGKRPYLDAPVEYPPLIGAAMQLAASISGVAPASHAVYRHTPSGQVQRDANGQPVVGHYTMDWRTSTFFDMSAVLFTIAALVTVVCTALTAGRRRLWDAALVALAPGLALHLLTNWDMIAVAFTAGALLAWSRRAPLLAGLLLGLGAATKAYPLLLLIPLGLLCYRAGQLRAIRRALVGAAAALVAVVLPVWVVAGAFPVGASGGSAARVAPSAWNLLWHGGDWLGALAPHHGGGTNALLTFVNLNQHRGADWDSLAFALEWVTGRYSTEAFGPLHLISVLVVAGLLAWATIVAVGRRPGARNALIGIDVIVVAAVAAVLPSWLTTIRDRDIATGTLNAVTLVLFVLLLAGIGLLALAAPRRPRLAQLGFLTVVAFLLTNKVDSPQYVLWLIPLAALARPRWRAFLMWQATEALEMFTRFMHFIFNDTGGRRGIDRGWFVSAVCLRDIALLALAGLVVREILRPELDVVRADRVDGVEDDPAGGVLDGAADVHVWRPWEPRDVRPEEVAA